ncbi:glucose/mannose transport system permease protein [Sinorhizobium fredii]
MSALTRGSARPNQWLRNLNAKIASIPMILTALVIFLGGTIWTVVYSFTNSKLLPRLSFVGLDQYERLWAAPRWIVSIQNLAVYGFFSLIFSLVIGFVLAALMDQKIRFENTFRTIMLYPFALSFIVTGLVWQWLLNPQFGVQSIMRSLGWTSFSFDPLYDADIVIYGILIAALWQGTGLVMCLMLAGLRGIDEDIWKAARVDGIPMWKTYVLIIIPMMRGVFITTLVIIASGIVKVYDLVVAQTSGGTGDRIGSSCQIRLRLHVPRPEPGPGFRRLHHDAHHRRHHHRALGISGIRRRPQAWITWSPATTRSLPMTRDPGGSPPVRAAASRAAGSLVATSSSTAP